MITALIAEDNSSGILLKEAALLQRLKGGQAVHGLPHFCRSGI